MKAVFIAESSNGEPVIHTDQEAFDLLTAPAVRTGSCFEPVLQALLGFETYNRWAKEVKLRPVKFPMRPRWDPDVVPYLAGIRVVTDL